LTHKHLVLVVVDIPRQNNETNDPGHGIKSLQLKIDLKSFEQKIY